ncbi:hypothetical protein, partial [Xanthomonas translucens]|uniref:hypothetical protein n=1 Tax=Xanthomonas campestris pv. translucens TaxID=343 RepID=UPI0019D37532
PSNDRRCAAHQLVALSTPACMIEPDTPQPHERTPAAGATGHHARVTPRPISPPPAAQVSEAPNTRRSGGNHSTSNSPTSSAAASIAKPRRSYGRVCRRCAARWSSGLMMPLIMVAALLCLRRATA